jgi:hypothetical protein
MCRPLLSLLEFLVATAAAVAAPGSGFSLDNPPGPQFGGAEKEAQRERGAGVGPMVRRAFEAGADSVVIPPGDYRFGKERWGRDGPVFPLEFRGMKRDAAHPFRILAEGVTFWFESLNHDARTPVLSGLTIRGNTFLRPGRHAISFGLVSGGEISGNIVRESGLPRRLAGLPPPREGEQPVQLHRCAGITVSGNRLEPGEAPSSAVTAVGLVNARESSEVTVHP